MDSFKWEVPESRSNDSIYFKMVDENTMTDEEICEYSQNVNFNAVGP